MVLKLPNPANTWLSPFPLFTWVGMTWFSPPHTPPFFCTSNYCFNCVRLLVHSSVLEGTLVSPSCRFLGWAYQNLKHPLPPIPFSTVFSLSQEIWITYVYVLVCSGSKFTGVVALPFALFMYSLNMYADVKIVIMHSGCKEKL